MSWPAPDSPLWGIAHLMVAALVISLLANQFDGDELEKLMFLVFGGGFVEGVRRFSLK